jgi:hypothetical protein
MQLTFIAHLVLFDKREPCSQGILLLSGAFPIQRDLTEGDALSSLLFNSILECTIRKSQKNQYGLESNGIYQPVVHAGDVNFFG